MRPSACILVLCALGLLLGANFTPAQTEIANSRAIALATTIYLDDQSGSDAVAKKTLAELRNWGRFRIVWNKRKADLILVLSTDPHQGGNLLYSGGQTGTIDSQGHIQEDEAPTYNKLAPVRHAFLIAVDVRTGNTVWSDSQRWGGLLTGFDDVGEHLVKEFEKRTEAAEREAGLKLVKSVEPAFPAQLSVSHIEGTVIVRIVVDKNGKVSSAKALGGPSELFAASVQAAKQFQFEPPRNAPITTELEIPYGNVLTPCPPGKKGERGVVTYAEKLPMRSGHPGALNVVGDISVPIPPYPHEAPAAGREGDLELIITVSPHGDVIGTRVAHSLDPTIDETAIATVRTWRFKVTRGEAWSFPIRFRYQMACDFPADK